MSQLVEKIIQLVRETVMESIADCPNADPWDEQAGGAVWLDNEVDVAIQLLRKFHPSITFPDWRRCVTVPLFHEALQTLSRADLSFILCVIEMGGSSREDFFDLRDKSKEEILAWFKDQVRGQVVLTWDCKTRATDELSYKLKDTITSIAYMSNRGQMTTHTFVSNKDKSSIRQFVDWLIQSKQKFHCYAAHNGASFNNYFLLNSLTEEEYKSAEITKLGLGIASIRFAGHELTDNRLHVVSSLESLCGDYKMETPKMTSFVVDGKPQLSFWEFMQLEKSEPEFWKLYRQYCEVDCVSLYQIWKSYLDLLEMKQNKEKDHVFPNRVCKVCQKEGKMMKCSVCMDAYYCSAACQKSDWKKHKKSCTKKE